MRYTHSYHLFPPAVPASFPNLHSRSSQQSRHCPASSQNPKPTSRINYSVASPSPALHFPLLTPPTHPTHHVSTKLASSSSISFSSLASPPPRLPSPPLPIAQPASPRHALARHNMHAPDVRVARMNSRASTRFRLCRNECCAGCSAGSEKSRPGHLGCARGGV